MQQDEGGRYLKYSRREILQFFSDGKDLPSDLRELSIRRSEDSTSFVVILLNSIFLPIPLNLAPALFVLANYLESPYTVPKVEETNLFIA